MINRDLLPPSHWRHCPIVLACLLVLATPALAGTYDLQFLPAGPLTFSEDDSFINFQVQVVGGCMPFNVDWEPAIVHITTDGNDLGAPMPIPVGLSDINPILGITIPVNNDAIIEGTESFIFELSQSANVDMNCTVPATVPAGATYKIEIFLEDNEFFNDDHLIVQDAQADESAGSLIFEVRRVNADISQSASATFTIFPDSATPGVDYNDPPGTALFFPMGGPDSQFVAVPLIDDAVRESNETLFLKLTSVTGSVIGDYAGVGTILDNDGPALLKIFDLTVDEGDTERTVQVDVLLEIEDGVNTAVTVDYVVESGSAELDSDFVLSPGTLVFEPGQTSKKIPVRILGDTTPESDEDFVIRLQNPSGALLSRPAATVTLRNDDESTEPVVSADDVSVLEGDEGGTEVTVAVQLDRDGPFSIAYATEDGTAVAGVDYEALEGILDIPAGVNSGLITVTVLGDLEVEGDEMFRLRLSDASPVSAPATKAGSDGDARSPRGARSTPAVKLLGDTDVVITILDDDEEGTGGDPPEVSVLDTEVSEGNEGTTPARFRLHLSHASETAVSVFYETFDGTADAGSRDYLPRTGQVTFDPGQTDRIVQVPVAGDTTVEEDEVFGLRLTEADGAVIVRAQAICVIINDDEDNGGTPVPSGASVRLLPTQPVTEGQGPARIRLERLGSNLGPVTALVVVGGGTATVGQDLPQVRRLVRWRAGQRGIVDFEIPIVDDVREEDTEFFLVRIIEARNAEIGSPSEARQVIVDDDTPMQLVAVSDLEQTVRAGTEVTLEARVQRDDGQPVGGASVRWIGQRKARLTGEGVTFSDADGIVRQTIQFDARPGVARVGALLIGTDSGLAFQFRVEGNLDGTVGDDDGNDGDVADAFDAGCGDEDEGDAFSEACDYLYGIAGEADRRNALDALTPRQSLPSQRQALRAPRNQVRNVSARLSALRGGMARSTFDQLALSIQGQGLSLGPLQDAITQSDPAGDTHHQLGDRVDLALRKAAGLAALNPLRGGAASADDEASVQPGGTDGNADAGAGNGFDYGGESPWGLFFNGRISFGDAPRLGERPDFEFQTDGVTLGIDRRVGANWVVGAALGYTRSVTDVGGDQGHLDLTGLSLSLYTTFYTDSWYFDGVFTHGDNEFDVERVIDLPVAFRGTRRLIAVGSPDATQTAANLSFGYDFRLGEALTLSGFLRANWTRAEIDAYTETGALLFDLAYESQTLDSLLGEVGVELSRPISFSWGVLQPLLRLALLHEFDNDLDVVRARFAHGRLPRTFRLEGAAIDRDFFNVAIGATATLPRGWATYLQYDTDLERDDLDLYTFSGGFRFQF